MNPPVEPPRLADLPARDDPANLARLVRSATLAPADQVPRLKWRIRSTLRRRSVWRRRYLRVAFVGGAMLLTGGVVGAVLQPIFKSHQQSRTDSVENIYPSPSAPRSRHVRPAQLVSDSTEQAVPALDRPGAIAPSGSPPDPTPAARKDVPAQTPTPPRPVRAEAASAPLRLPARAPSTAPDPSGPPMPTRRPAPLHPDRPPGQSHGFRTALLEPPPEKHEPLPIRPSPVSETPTVASAAQGSVATSPTVPHPTAPRTEPSPHPASDVVPRPAVAAFPPAAAPKAATTPPPSEQVLLARALFSLRSEHRPERAIAVLDQYRAAFPAGSLQPEAARLRTEALLALGQKGAALAELNRESDPGGASTEESRLVRAELQAAAGHWKSAFDDFDAVVYARRAHERTEASGSPKLRERLERALWGRASARSHLGDEAGARADLRECLRRFPRGRFAVEAARLLGELR